MGKFLAGLASGVVLVILFLGILAFVALRSPRKPIVGNDSTLILRITGDIPEKPAVDLGLPFLEQRSVTVENLWSMLRRAAGDSRIKAVVLEPESVGAGWAKLQEIHADLEQFRKSGKPLVAYLKSPGTREYYLATACSKIYMAPVDLLDLKGVALGTMYFKNSLDKLGVQVDVEHAGKYKDFGDMFTRSTMSPETREVMTSMVDDIYGDLVATVARRRGKDAFAVRNIIDNGPFLSTQAKASGLVDELRFEDQVFGELKTQLHQKELKKISEKEYLDVPDSDAGLRGKDKIAWVVGDGSITRGTADSNDQSGIQSEQFDRMLNRVANDGDVKGVIVRIDSPGGEVTASDDIWRAMNELGRKKPMVISMSDDAASGGYYMAMTGAPIVAYPATITGSIGVVFGKPNLHGLYDKLGITKDYVARGRFALIDSDYESLSDAGRQKLKEGIDAEYQDFLEKVAAARKKPVDAVGQLAQGRVWMGDQAKANGLVDELGGIDRAVEMIKARSGIAAGNQVTLVRYPAKRSLWDMVFKSGTDADSQVRTMLRTAGLQPLLEAWNDASLRVWMRGGMIRMMPFRIEIK